MDHSLTVSTRTLLLGLLVAVALVAAYLLGGNGPAPVAVAEESPVAPTVRELTTTGTGEASAVPDQLGFAVHVHVTRPDLDDALAAANAVMSRVQAALVEHGVAEEDLQTTGLSMDPVYEYHQYDPPSVVGYRVSQHSRVLVQELGEGGAAVGAAVEAGGNDVRVDSLRLLVSDADAVMAQARKAAVEEAGQGGGVRRGVRPGARRGADAARGARRTGADARRRGRAGQGVPVRDSRRPDPRRPRGGEGDRADRVGARVADSVPRAPSR